ncbi:Trm112 family protein [Roseospirillum parvum]|nr:Trm112 family protein [Roseospirillum parvum]
MTDAPTSPLDPKLLEILVAPGTGAPLTYDAKGNRLIDQKAGVAYPIRDGIPIMLADEAEPLADSAS